MAAAGGTLEDMSGIVCPECGDLVAPGTPGKAALCPRCMRPVEMPSTREAADFWSNSIAEWEAAVADAPRELAAALGNGRSDGRPDPYRRAIHALFALVAFLIALIGAVLVARQLRPLVFRPRPVSPELQQALHQLEAAQDPDARLEAARKLVALGPEAVATALDRFTTAGNGSELPSIPQPIVHALADVGPEATASLGKALGSPTAKPGVRAAAAEVLSEMGAQGSGAQTALVAALADKNNWVRWYAVEALGNMGAEAASAVPALLPLLEHSDALTRRRAVEALGRIGPPAKAAAAALQNASQPGGDEAVRKAAVVALYQVYLADRAEKARLGAVTDVRQLIDKLPSGDQYAVVAAAKGLGEWGDADAVPALALALRDKRAAVREAAAQALGSLGSSARNVRPALQAAAHEADPAVRAAARKALDQIGDR